MKKVGINYRSKLGTALVEGERLELKIDRMTQNNEPIGDSAPLIYTPRNTFNISLCIVSNYFI